MITITADELPRFMACNGSLNMPAAFPSTTTDTTARDEGIAAHHMANLVFSGQSTLDVLVDRKAPNGVYMISEMADHVGEYLSALDCGQTEVVTTFGRDEWRVNGRADHIGYNASTDVLCVDDLKYGWRIVEPVMNWTLLAHAIGFCFANNIRPHLIKLRIHQPRPHHTDGKIRTWDITSTELLNYYAQLDASLSNPADELRTSVAQCGRCPALATCPAARHASMNAIDAAEMIFSDDIANPQLSFEIDILRIAQATLANRLSALEEMAMHRLKGGGVIENYASEAQYANTRWLPHIDAAMLYILTGKDLAKSATVTPAEAKRRGVPADVIKTLTERPMIGHKLTRVGANARAQRLLGKGNGK